MIASIQNTIDRATMPSGKVVYGRGLVELDDGRRIVIPGNGIPYWVLSGPLLTDAEIERHVRPHFLIATERARAGQEWPEERYSLAKGRVEFYARYFPECRLVRQE